ncbi:acetyltransferase, GNAT family protein [Toxoplasma gondii ARI]|uniref:Acetyltransferase, GNAT family protein n=1 Tax=Toxoplasma gondii ARI TaxID=1074872 RepID=A0A139XS88_TOXGO|nr:acetyltransferase, GNAT family protein [Toxoplasma gondii ARI]
MRGELTAEGHSDTMESPARKLHLPAEETLCRSSSFSSSPSPLSASSSHSSSSSSPSSSCSSSSSFLSSCNLSHLRFRRFPRLLPLSVVDRVSERLRYLSSSRSSFHVRSRSSLSSASVSSCFPSSCSSLWQVSPREAWRARDAAYEQAVEDLRDLEERQQILMREREKCETDIQALLKSTLSEPYSVFTLRYFLDGWPELTVLAYDGDVCAGACICKVDEKARSSSLADLPLFSFSSPRSDRAASLRTSSSTESAREQETRAQFLDDQEQRGAVSCEAARSRQAAVGKGYIAMLSVHPNYRRRGLAAHLVQTALEEMRSRKRRNSVETIPSGEESGDKIEALQLLTSAAFREVTDSQMLRQEATEHADHERGQEKEEEKTEEETTGKVVSCRIETEAGNEGALRLYESLSFVRVARMQRFYLNDSDAFKLSRSFENEQACSSTNKEATRENRLQKLLSTSTCWW